MLGDKTMDFDDIFTKEQQAIMVNYAMRIDTGEVSEEDAIALLDEAELQLQKCIIVFWMRFNDMTCQVAERLAIRKAQMHLEKCYKKGNIKCLMQNILQKCKKLITNGQTMN